MLTALELENFKGIAGRQRIDLAPLTLLFGANSAGKSTILQALLYLHELVERGSADVDRTELGGSVLELGGFVRLVHKHEVERPIILRAEFATPGGLERFGRDLTDFILPDLDDEVDSAWLEVTIRFRTTPTFRGPIVDAATVGVNGHDEPLVWLATGSSLRDGEPLFVRVNVKHPIFGETAAGAIDEWTRVAVSRGGQLSLIEEGGPDVPDQLAAADDPSLPVFALSSSLRSALPSLREPLRVLMPGGDEPTHREEHVVEEVRTFLEMIVLGTTSQLASFLRDALYIGPLRTIPPRGSLYERRGRATSWADGLAAWDLLLADRLTLVERTNNWLRRLGAGCQVTVQQLFDRGAEAEEISEGHIDKTVRRLLLETGGGSLVLPSEVGAGISQVIPVIVAALEGRIGLTLIEQPEIHVHPAVQVGLGDLLIDAATREGSRRLLLVETHSEHLLLRLMKRMRETADDGLPEGARAVRPKDVSIMIVEKDGSRSIVRQMPLNERGELVKAWPGGFFEEGLKEVF